MKVPRTKKVKSCLLCKNKKLKKVFSLGNLFVSNFVKKKNISYFFRHNFFNFSKPEFSMF